MVADQHRLADREIRSQAACGVGQDHGVHTGRARSAHGVHDVAQLVALVGVDAADEHQHPVIARRTDITSPLCPCAVGGVKPGSSAIGTTAVGAPSSSAAGAQSGAEHDRDVVAVDAGALADRGCGLLCCRVGIGHSSASLARR